MLPRLDGLGYGAALAAAERVPIGRHHTLRDFLASATAERLGIRNVPADSELPDVVAALRALAENALDPIEAALGPVHITAGWRSPALNDATEGGSTACAALPGGRAATSAAAVQHGCGSGHLYGAAADFNVEGYTGELRSAQVADAILQARERGAPIRFDQLVWYAPGSKTRHVHVGYWRPATGRTNRLLVTESRPGVGYVHGGLPAATLAA